MAIFQVGTDTKSTNLEPEMSPLSKVLTAIVLAGESAKPLRGGLRS